MEGGGDHKARVREQAEIWKFMFSLADSMALKCAVELRIPDIINSHGGAPITLSRIVADISGLPDTSRLARLMRLLVRRNIFAVHPGREQPLYGLTHLSRWLLHDTPGPTLAPMVLLQTHDRLTAPWRCLPQCVADGGSGFGREHGREVFKFASENAEFSGLFDDAMACTSTVVMEAVFEEYKEGFAGLKTLVDVGGGTGAMMAEIVRVFPDIEGINFDLPHVVVTAPVFTGVSHVGGDMFESVPCADAVFLKWILHDWSDEDCVKILKNCRKAIPERIGKIIIVETILKLQGNDDVINDAALLLDLAMMVHTPDGKERTEQEWKVLLEEGGFPRFKIIEIPSLLSIIEAYPL